MCFLKQLLTSTQYKRCMNILENWKGPNDLFIVEYNDLIWLYDSKFSSIPGKILGKIIFTDILPPQKIRIWFSCVCLNV